MREEILELMLEKCTEVFGAADLTSTTRFSDLGAGSVQMVQIATFFENEYDVEIPFMDFNRQNNIKEAVDYLVSLFIQNNERINNKFLTDHYQLL